MTGDFKAGLQSRGFHVFQIAGIFQGIKQGGLGFKRLCNATWMMICLPFYFSFRLAIRLCCDSFNPHRCFICR